MYREYSSGGIVFKKQDSPKRIIWLITKSSPSNIYQSIWRLPKGWLDDINNGKSPGPKASGKIRASKDDFVNAALREVAEEAGVKAKILNKLGTIKIIFIRKDTNKKILKFVTFFLMEWINDIPEGFSEETKEVAWLPYRMARGKLKYSAEKKMLDKASRVVEKKLQ